MVWVGLHGHDRLVEQFQLAIDRDRVNGSYLFVGPTGVGKRTFATLLAQTLLCESCVDTGGGERRTVVAPCRRCDACTLVEAGTHPDLIVVAKPRDRASIPLELLVGDKEHRRREGLCHDISLKPFRGRRKVAILQDADDLNAEGANALLKTLEEPPPQSVMILVGTTPSKQLPTIRSRCRIIRFSPLRSEILVELLLAHEVVSARDEALQLAVAAEGSFTRAVALVDPAVTEFRDDCGRRLGSSDVPWRELAPLVRSFVEEAGKEAPLRRERLRTAIGVFLDTFRKQLRSLDVGDPGDVSVRSKDATLLLARADRCLEALDELARNANPTTLITAWVDDLQRGRCASQRVAAL